MPARPEERPAPTDLGARVRQSAIWVGLAGYLQLGISFIGSIILSRILAPRDFGYMAIATSLYSTALGVSQFGFDATLLAKQDMRSAMLGTHLALRGITALITCVVAVLFYPAVSRHYSSTAAAILVWLALFGLVQATAMMPRTVLQYRFAFNALALAEVLAVILGTTVSVVMARAGYGVASLVAGSVSSVLAQAAVTWCAFGRFPPLIFQWTLVRGYMRQAGYFWGTNALTLAVMYADNLSVATFCTATQVGYYTRAFAWAVLPAILSAGVLSKIARSLYARLQEDTAALERVYHVVAGSILRLSVLFGVSLFAVIPELVTGLLGQKWSPAVLLLRILTLYAIVRPVWEDQGTFLTMVQRMPAAMRLVAVAAVTMLILAPLLTIRYGPVGTASATSAALTLGMVFGLFEVRRSVPLRVWSLFMAPLISAGLCVGVVLCVERHASSPEWLKLASARIGLCWLILGLSYMTFDRTALQLTRLLIGHVKKRAAG